MRVKQCILKGKLIHSLDDIYQELARQLELPEHFGGNLDALWDCLTTDVEGPVEIILEDQSSARASLGHEFDRLDQLFRDLARQRKDISIIRRP